MLEFTESISINSNSETVYDTLAFLFQNSENYRYWHKDHVSCYWKKGSAFCPGSILIVKESLHGSLHTLQFQITDHVKNKLIEYKVLFPYSLVCSGGSFRMDTKGNETIFTARLHFRTVPLLKKLFKRQLKEVIAHMHEEGVNIKKIIESPMFTYPNNPL